MVEARLCSKSSASSKPVNIKVCSRTPWRNTTFVGKTLYLTNDISNVPRYPNPISTVAKNRPTMSRLKVTISRTSAGSISIRRSSRVVCVDKAQQQNPLILSRTFRSAERSRLPIRATSIPHPVDGNYPFRNIRGRSCIWTPWIGSSHNLPSTRIPINGSRQ